MATKDIFLLFKNIFTDWVSDNVTRLSASLAYYSIFSLSPLIGIVIAITGIVFGKEAARREVTNDLNSLFGTHISGILQNAISASYTAKEQGILVIVVGFLILMFGAATVFAELRSSLNLIYGVKVSGSKSFYAFIRDKFLAFSLVLGVGFLLLTSIFLSLSLVSLRNYFSVHLLIPDSFIKIGDFTFSMIITSGLFAMIFGLVSDVILSMRGVLLGGILTALFFTVGKTLLAWYLGTSAIGSIFGAAGAFLAILLWFYYAACILFFGAEFVKNYEYNFGRGITAKHYAQMIPRVTQNQ